MLIQVPRTAMNTQHAKLGCKLASPQEAKPSAPPTWMLILFHGDGSYPSRSMICAKPTSVNSFTALQGYAGTCVQCCNAGNETAPEDASQTSSVHGCSNCAFANEAFAS